MPVLEAIGLDLGPGFPANAFDDTNKRVWAKVGASPTSQQFAGAWNGVALRYFAVQRRAAQLDASLKTYSGAPPPVQRAEEEDALFGLYGAALSSIECMMFAAYFVGSIVQPAAFPFVANLRKIDPKATGEAFALAFPGDPVVAVINGVRSAPALIAISDERNTLSHRGAPGRAHNVSIHEGASPPSPAQDSTTWNLDGGLLQPGIGQAREAEIAAILSAGITGIDAFSAGHF